MSARAWPSLFAGPALLAAAACSVPTDFVPDWDRLPGPVDAASECVFTSTMETWKRGTCSPVFEGVADWEEGGIGGYDVEAFDVMSGTGYLMLYTGLAVEGTFENAAVIGAAASLDGIHWSRYADGPILVPDDPTDRISVGCTAVRESDATLHLWAVDEDQEVFHGVSLDGTSWVFDPDPVAGVVGEDPAEARFFSFQGCSAHWDEEAQVFDIWWSGVVRYGEPFAYTYAAEIVSSTSADGSQVSLAPTDSHFLPSGSDSGLYDSVGVANPGVLCQDGECWMFYVGWKALTSPTAGDVQSGDHQLGLAGSADGGITWQRADMDLSLLPSSDEPEDIDRPRPVFANGWMMLFVQENFGLASTHVLSVGLMATPWPPGSGGEDL